MKNMFVYLFYQIETMKKDDTEDGFEFFVIAVMIIPVEISIIFYLFN